MISRDEKLCPENIKFNFFSGAKRINMNTPRNLEVHFLNIKSLTQLSLTHHLGLVRTWLLMLIRILVLILSK